MISHGGGRGGLKILEKFEDHYIKSHLKCEDGGGGVKIVKKTCEIKFEWPLTRHDDARLLPE